MAVNRNLWTDYVERRQNLQNATHTLLDCVDMLAAGALQVNQPEVLREAAVMLEVLEARIKGSLQQHQRTLRAKAFDR